MSSNHEQSQKKLLQQFATISPIGTFFPVITPRNYWDKVVSTVLKIGEWITEV